MVAINATIAGAVTNNGVIELVGTVNFTDGLALASGGSLGIDLNSLDSFDTVAIGDVASLDGELDIDVHGYTPTAGDLFEFLTATGGVEGDFNYDGTVDAAGYTVWRDGLGTDFVQADYGVWVANFGANAPAIAFASSNSVPEPTSVLLLLVAAASLTGLRGRRRC